MKLRSSRPRKSAAPARKSRRSAVGQIFEYPKLWRIVTGVVLVSVALAVLYHFIDADKVHDYAERLDPFAAFALLTVLPLVGFPVNVLHVAAGIRFGFVLGMALVALSILIQLLASYAIVHLWPKLFAKRLAKVRAKIPPAAHGTVCLFTLLLPGVPFMLQNYTLPLIGVPLRTYLSRCWPLHTARAVLTVGLGQQSGHFTPIGVAALVGYWVLVLAASWWTYRRLQRQLGDQPSAASGRMQPA